MYAIQHLGRLLLFTLKIVTISFLLVDISLMLVVAAAVVAVVTDFAAAAIIIIISEQ